MRAQAAFSRAPKVFALGKLEVNEHGHLWLESAPALWVTKRRFWAVLGEHLALVLDFKFSVKLAFYYNGAKVPASPRRSQVSLTAAAGTNYLDPVSKVVSFVVRGTAKPVRVKHLDVAGVGLGASASFSDFFADNFADPNAVDSSYSALVPPTYAANYNPDDGSIVKSNTFVANLASVLNISPSRIRVVNIVPGNRRRLKELAALHPGQWQHVYESAEATRRRLLGDDDDDDGLALDFEMSALDVCEDVACGQHGDCNAAGACDCDAGWAGDACNATWVNCTALAGATNDDDGDACAPSPNPTAGPAERRRHRALLAATNATTTNGTNATLSTYASCAGGGRERRHAGHGLRHHRARRELARRRVRGGRRRQLHLRRRVRRDQRRQLHLRRRLRCVV